MATRKPTAVKEKYFWISTTTTDLYTEVGKWLDKQKKKAKRKKLWFDLSKVDGDDYGLTVTYKFEKQQ